MRTRICPAEHDNDLGVIIQNTRSMDIRPGPPDDYNALDAMQDKPAQCLVVLSGEAFHELVNYPVIVEMWEKTKAGRVKRAWQKEFTSAERNKVARYYGRFFRWHLVTGTPKNVSCRVSTIDLLRRAVAFFAGV